MINKDTTTRIKNIIFYMKKSAVTTEKKLSLMRFFGQATSATASRGCLAAAEPWIFYLSGYTYGYAAPFMLEGQLDSPDPGCGPQDINKVKLYIWVGEGARSNHDLPFLPTPPQLHKKTR